MCKGLLKKIRLIFKTVRLQLKHGFLGSTQNKNRLKTIYKSIRIIEEISVCTEECID